MNFSGTPGISPQKSWDIPPKSLVSLGFEGHTELFGPHPFTSKFTRKTPHPTRRYPDQKVWVWVSLSCLIQGKAPGLIQLGPTVLASWSRVLLAPAPRSVQELHNVSRTSICFMAPSSTFLELLPPRPPVQKRNAQHKLLWHMRENKTMLRQASTWNCFWRDFLEVWGVPKQTSFP